MIRDSITFEMQELKRISDKIFAVIDSEKNCGSAILEKGRLQFASICKEIGVNCHVLERRATENYFSDQAVKAVKGEKYRSLKPYEKLSTSSVGWPKSENWRIAREMRFSEIENTDLGRFLLSI